MKILRKITYIFALAALLAACAADEPAPAPVLPTPTEEHHTIGFYVNLETMGASRATLAGDYNPGDAFENFIGLEEDQPDVWVALFAADNSFLTKIEKPVVERIAYTPAGKRYLLTFDVSREIFETLNEKPFKIAMLANCHGKYPAAPGDLDKIDQWWGAENYLDYTVLPSGSLKEGDRIPLFGVVAFKATVLETYYTNILTEPLHLLRALAKVEVYDSTESYSPIESVELVRHNVQCRPFPTGVTHQSQYVKNSWDADYTDGSQLNPGATETTDIVPFARTARTDGLNHFTIYCPVYRHVLPDGSLRPQAQRQRILVAFECGIERYVEFRDYRYPDTQDSSWFDVNRNYWYRFQVELTTPVIPNVIVDVLPYKLVDLTPGFGLDPEFPQ